MVTEQLDTPIGMMVATATPHGISSLNFADKIAELPFPSEKVQDNTASMHIKTLKSELKEYFDGSRKEFSVALDFNGTGFCIRVWKELLKIPYGSTRTYNQQAKALEMPHSVRAVARANALNRMIILVPCHRVIGTNGKLTGYSGGMERKSWLLIHEKKNSQSSDNELF